MCPYVRFCIVDVSFLVCHCSFFSGRYTQSPKWSQLSFEAVVQETVIQPDGEVRLIVERTTEIYGSPMNSLGISESTVLVDTSGNPISIEAIQPGDTVKVTLKNAFNEETPFYYPTVYEIKTLNDTAG